MQRPARKQAPPTREDLLALARQRFLRGEPIDMQRLAVELGISRATLYRWAGNAGELMGRVVASFGEETFRRAMREARGRGAARVVSTMERGMRLTASFRPYRAFLERDPQSALRIVASKDGPVQQQTIAQIQALIEEEVAAGRLSLPVDAHSMAYALVRIAESFLYADSIAGEEPDIDKAVEIVKLMLR
jgi:AcrR family transcriptional regulator